MIPDIVYRVALIVGGFVNMPHGTEYRFRVVDDKRLVSRPGGEDEWTAGRPEKFGDRQFRVGQFVTIDYDPENPAFLYPPGRYPRIRAWGIPLCALLMGALAAVLGVASFSG